MCNTPYCCQSDNCFYWQSLYATAIISERKVNMVKLLQTISDKKNVQNVETRDAQNEKLCKAGFEAGLFVINKSYDTNST